MRYTSSMDMPAIVRRTRATQYASDQAAKVRVDSQAAGSWWQPLGNQVQRFVDDSFLLPARLTAGSDRIVVTLIPLWAAPWHAVPLACRPLACRALPGSEQAEMTPTRTTVFRRVQAQRDSTRVE